jgi:ferrous iron transport protein B
MKHLRRDASEQTLLMELPAWQWPQWQGLVQNLWDKARLFLRRSAGIILALTILLWFFSSFPQPPLRATEPAIYYSLAGRIGRGLAVVLAPLGFNWQICVALIPGLAAREVAVSALGTVYALSGTEAELTTQLGFLITHQWSLPTALSLLAWYVFAPQCLSTLAVIYQETHSRKNVVIATGYLFGLAYFASFLTYQVTLRLI